MRILLILFFVLLVSFGQAQDVCKDNFEQLIKEGDTLAPDCDVVGLSLYRYGYYSNQESVAKQQAELLTKMRAEIPKYQALVDSLEGLRKERAKELLKQIEIVEEQLELRSISLDDAVHRIAELTVELEKMKERNGRLRNWLVYSTAGNVVTIVIFILLF